MRPAELMEKFSAQPQALNYYSYVANNPLVLVDPEGEHFIFAIAVAVVMIALEVVDVINTAIDTSNFVSSPSIETGVDVGLDAGLAMIPGNTLITAGVKKIKNAPVAKVKTVLSEGIKKTKDQVQKSIDSYWAQVDAHKEKLENYIKDPDKYDNKGLLDGKSAEERFVIVDARIQSLKKQINGFIEKIEQAKDDLTKFKE